MLRTIVSVSMWLLLRLCLRSYLCCGYYCVEMPVTAILGEQRGDEGKGRFVDMLMPEHDVGARFNGGDNAGHTVVDPDGNVYKLHGMPTSIVHEGKMSVIGNGAVMNALNITKEIEILRNQGVEVNERNLLISGSAHLTMPHHVSRDEVREAGIGRQGSTKSGMAQVYGAKHERLGLRAEEIKNNPGNIFDAIVMGLRHQKAERDMLGMPDLDEIDIAKEYVDRAKRLGAYITDTALFLNRELAKDKNVLAEGAQAFLLDIDHGMYSYVTSSSTTAGGVSTGLGVAPHHIKRTIGVVKAVQSHVGDGPFVTEIHDEELLRKLRGKAEDVDGEYGTTTQRPRRLGNFDIPQIKRAQMINGTTEMALTKLDCVPLFGERVNICVQYERSSRPNGKKKSLAIAPDAAYKLEQCEPTYFPRETWKEDISSIRSFEDLPKEAQEYIDFIQFHTGVPITMIGVGPSREEVIVRG